MGFWDNVRGLVYGAFDGYSVQYDTTGGFTPVDVMKMDAAQLWRDQPHLRTVVTFMARNIAQLGLQSFERVSETDRQRDRTGVLARTLKRPNDQSTSYELVFGLVADLALYDVGYWMTNRSTTSPSGWTIHRVPATWVTPRKGDAFGYREYRIQVPGALTWEDIPAERILPFHGWSPNSARDGSSPVHALKSILAEQIQAVRYREAVWKRGGKVSAVITRQPKTPWTDGQREAFRADWNSKFTGSGSQTGGTPILEDGMTLNKVDFSAHEQQFVEGAKLALTTVAAVYHVNPTMIGLLDNANYSNVREFRKMLYGDTLGPVIAMIEDRVNAFLVPQLEGDRDVYVEFNIGEKLQGNFEEQSAALQASVGRPWMTADEARAKQNMPAIGGYAEELVTPLNVLVGGQSGVTDGQTADGGGNLPDPAMIVELVNAAATLIRSGFEPAAALIAVGLDPIVHLGLLPVTIQRPEEPENVDQEAVDAIKAPRLVLLKSRAPDTYATKYGQVLTTFFKRQRASVVGKLGGKASPDWWDEKRWNGELADDLYKLAVLTSTEVGTTTASELGFEPGDYDVDRTLAFLRETTKRSSKRINKHTLERIQAALASAEDADDPLDAAGTVFDEAEGSRAAALAIAAVTTISGFAALEAGKQVGAATKTWITGANPRSEHAAMDGETVAISENFSNSLAWPGDSSGSADDLAGCNCELVVNF